MPVGNTGDQTSPDQGHRDVKAHRFTALERHTLTEPEALDLERLVRLSQLSHLDIERYAFGHGHMVHLGCVTSLVNLKPHYCSKLIAQALREISSLVGLTRLHLGYAIKIPGKGVDKISDDDVASLARLPILSDVCLYGCDTSHTGIGHLAAVRGFDKGCAVIMLKLVPHILF